MKHTIRGFAFVVILTLISFLATGQQTSLSYICPVPGSKYINPEQNIILKTLSSFDPGVLESNMIHLLGSRSGLKQVDLILSPDQKTLLIIPGQEFSLDEKVDVCINGLRTLDGKPIPEIKFVFYTKEKEPGEISSFDEWEMDSSGWKGNGPNEKPQKNHSWLDKDLPPDFPGPVTSTSGYISSTYTFTNLDARMLGPFYNNYSVILDNFGTPIYYQRTPNHNYFNFHVLPNGLLTWCRNFATMSPNEKYYIADSSYNIIDSVRTGNGYDLDSHDMLWMDNGHYLVMSYDPQPVNMSLIVPGGNPDAIVTGLIIQEVDNNENVFWQWRSWDHFEITDATPDINLTALSIDYCHGNAFEFDYDGNLLLSSRNMDEITKIDYNTGDIIWRFGKNATNNQFDIINDPVGFSHQHDIRKMPNGHYTLYDNGNLHQSQFSRAMEYNIDEDNMLATLVWNYQHEPIIYAPATGSFRVLENEKRIVGWGATISEILMTELNPDNSLSMELIVPGNVTCYRALKFSWETNLYTTINDLSFGNFAGYDNAKEMYLFINNNSGNVIDITSSHNHLTEYEVLTELPISIFPNTSTMITIAFAPYEPGIYTDVLTLNYDNFDNTRRIARQLTLNGLLEDEIPSVFFIPENGAANIDPATAIQIIFDEPVRKAGGNEILDEDIPDIIILKKDDREGEAIAFSGVISEDKMIITINPDFVLEEEQQYYVELMAETVEDFDGNIIEFAEGSFFTTGMAIGMVEHPKKNMQVYPNPCSGVLHLRVTRYALRVTSIDLFEISGRKIRRLDEEMQGPGVYEKSYDLSDLPEGVYFIRLQAGDELMMKKIVKMD
ncbi:MAG: aryl-sulfate sulfotransferase [Bacteroidota bacterium]|nr:aryl-sulfate sulfotransferase [Bacteroidota bacterium]